MSCHRRTSRCNMQLESAHAARAAHAVSQRHLRHRVLAPSRVADSYVTDSRLAEAKGGVQDLLLGRRNVIPLNDRLSSNVTCVF